MHEPKQSHLQAAYRILHYLKGSLGKGILFKRNGTTKSWSLHWCKLCRCLL